jgi:hypothetical protein
VIASFSLTPKVRQHVDGMHARPLFESFDHALVMLGELPEPTRDLTMAALLPWRGNR